MQGGQDMRSSASGAAAASGLFTSKAVARDDESRLAAVLRRTQGMADAPAAVQERETEGCAKRQAAGLATAERVVAAIKRAVEARLPGRVAALKVDVLDDQFVLRGVSSSYYVKQVAGHLAMTTLDASVAGRLSNEIEVRSVR
jgi:hypothetical protein